MHTLSNQLLQITIRQPGAELCKITSVNNKKEFMWSGNPDVWSGIAPNLFPIIGYLKNDSYIFEGKTYHMPKHGFLRKSKDIVLHEQTKNSLTYKLTSNHELLKFYPFKFEFYITYTLDGSTITVNYTVKNTDTETIYFSLGGHPAFKCPIYESEKYKDYQLVFERNEVAETYLLDLQSFLLTDKTEPVFNNSNTIGLRYDLFDKDALIFKDLKSRKVTLQSKTHGAILSMRFNGFPYLGIWAKPNANYVCIEPWIGIADHENTDQQLTTKEGIVVLETGKKFRVSYSIEINEKHLI